VFIRNDLYKGISGVRKKEEKFIFFIVRINIFSTFVKQTIAQNTTLTEAVYYARYSWFTSV